MAELSYDQRTAIEMLERTAKILRVLADDPAVPMIDLQDAVEDARRDANYACMQLHK